MVGYKKNNLIKVKKKDAKRKKPLYLHSVSGKRNRETLKESEREYLRKRKSSLT